MSIASRFAALVLALLPVSLAAQSPRIDLALREIGPTAMSGRIVDLAVVDADPKVMYVASATGGVWKTMNGGVTFAPVFHKEATHSVGAIAVHQRDTGVVWVGTGERANRQSSSWGDGVYKSTDGGRSWRNVGLRETRHVGRIALHPGDANVAYVAAMGHLWGPNEDRGLYKTTDGGATWTRVLRADVNTGVVDVALDPASPEVVYAATYQRRRTPYGFDGDGPGSALHKSTDGGRTWRRLTSGLPPGELGRIGISVYPRDPRVVYVSVEQGWRYNASTAYTTRRAGVYRSTDRGETWTRMSDWNPRPMYASQPLVDPTDAARVYMQNDFSVSEDSGRTFRSVPQSLHGDDRILWVNPRDSRHLVKGDDGGLGISYDRGKTWLYVTNLPVSQWYRVAADTKRPYNLYGGLQDNGSWMGPSATYRREGILLDDWVHTWGGDGFVSAIDTVDNRTLYVNMQYLGLARYDLATRRTKAIRPGNARGAIQARRNWDAWGPGKPEPELGNAMVPANWDAPFIISPHDHNTLYAGTNVLWRSADRGDTWTALGDLTTRVNRRQLPIMGDLAHDSTASLDDGIPYYPTLTAIAESPRRRGVLYVGTDDGQLHVSRDAGRTFTNVTDRLPGLPRPTSDEPWRQPWIAGVEASRHADGTVYVAVNNYRHDDYANYLYRSTDFGQTWSSIAAGLPPERVVRTVREDPRNPRLLYAATELGVFWSRDGGTRWEQLTANLPTVAVNDLLVHPRDNDLVLATHGRGLWILDNANALQELTPEVEAKPAHLFTLEPAEQVRSSEERGPMGDMVFRGETPPAGATIDYWLRQPAPGALALTVRDAAGREVARLTPKNEPGVHRAVWNLRHADVVPARGRDSATAGPWVMPGTYTVRLEGAGAPQERRLVVRGDPRVDITLAERRRWHDAMVRIGAMLKEQDARTEGLSAAKARLDSVPEAGRSATAREETREAADVLPPMRELRERLATLYADVEGWPGDLTADQRAQIAYFEGWMRRLAPRAGRTGAGR
ncbi:MAG TPA: hypothetical protein VNA89_16305 [Gemmatimonadaceae bacterium]|nr:hypothetical protein [Gemmatimonadaceae bacterium]